jgi:hypothetical protein
MSLPFIAVFVFVFVLAVCFDLISQFTYHRKSISEIKVGFNRTVRRVFLLVVVMTISSLVYHYMGWEDGQPIHLPWHSN